MAATLQFLLTLKSWLAESLLLAVSVLLLFTIVQMLLEYLGFGDASSEVRRLIKAKIRVAECMADKVAAEAEYIRIGAKSEAKIQNAKARMLRARAKKMEAEVERLEDEKRKRLAKSRTLEMVEFDLPYHEDPVNSQE